MSRLLTKDFDANYKTKSRFAYELKKKLLPVHMDFCYWDDEKCREDLKKVFKFVDELYI